LKVRAKLEPTVNDSMQKWYKDSDRDVRWDEMEKDYALLQSLFPNDNEIAAGHAYAQAQIAVAAKSYEKARQFYEEALAKKPKWALALNGLGKVYMREDSPLKNEARAVALYQEAARSDPSFPWAYVNLSIYYRQKHDLPMAKDYMSKALAASPAQPSVLRSMGNICYNMRDYPQALDYYQKALANETDPSIQERLQKTIAESEAGNLSLSATQEQASAEPMDSIPGDLAAKNAASKPDETANARRLFEEARNKLDEQKQAEAQPASRALSEAAPGEQPAATGAAGTKPGDFVEIYTVSVKPRELAPLKVEYTPEARANRLQGVIYIEAEISERGEVAAARVVKAPSPDYGMGEALVKATLQMKFSPAIKDSVPVKTRLTFPVRLEIK
ncbi:MAG: TonB family protein, partial [Candidatus Marsarchaeota archaeon]|nr:TonB family protein [Candidatus Marsarchaeota archaeon]